MVIVFRIHSKLQLIFSFKKSSNEELYKRTNMILDEVICRQFLKDRIRLYTQFDFLHTDSYHKIYNDTRTTHSSFTQKIDKNRQCTPHMSLITAHKQFP